MDGRDGGEERCYGALRNHPSMRRDRGIKLVVLESTGGRIGRAGSPTSVEPKQNHGGRKDFGAAKGCGLTVDLGTYTGMDAGREKMAG